MINLNISKIKKEYYTEIEESLRKFLIGIYPLVDDNNNTDWYVNGIPYFFSVKKDWITVYENVFEPTIYYYSLTNDELLHHLKLVLCKYYNFSDDLTFRMTHTPREVTMQFITFPSILKHVTINIDLSDMK